MTCHRAPCVPERDVCGRWRSRCLRCGAATSVWRRRLSDAADDGTLHRTARRVAVAA